MEEKQRPAQRTVEVPEEVLAELIATQQMLAESQKSLRRQQRDARIWGWLKFLLLLGTMLVGWWYSQHLIFDLFGQPDTSPFEKSAVEIIGGEIKNLKNQIESHPGGVDQDIWEQVERGQ